MCDPALIEDIKLAVDIERLPTEFTVADIKEWMRKRSMSQNLMVLPIQKFPSSYSLTIHYIRPSPKKRKHKVLYTDLMVNYFRLIQLNLLQE